MSVFSEELIIPGSRDLPITFDVTFNPDLRKCPVVIFCHGFKGFKDWGPWNLVAEKFASAGFFFIKFNFSHNGVSESDLSDITDPEAFGKNTFSTELEDLGLLLDWVTSDNEIYRHYMDQENITLIGHSRGAGIALVKTIDDERVDRVICWAGAYNLKKFAELEDDASWKERGFTEVKNARTGQVYPIRYDFRKDYLEHTETLDLTKRLNIIDKPLLMIHGENDDVSPVSNARKIHEVVSHALLVTIPANHTFGASHPWEEKELPDALDQVVQASIEFAQL
ncbi:MAG: alpha/beta fold hydrolase [Bacteroidetes bacterium]|nr:alpha/beta fold hydrolase [Bacteroidota bacterium]